MDSLRKIFVHVFAIIKLFITIKTYADFVSDYKEIVTIPAGARHIRVEEMKPSSNALALSAADRQTFYLNGD
jgi:hypothetical protein